MNKDRLREEIAEDEGCKYEVYLDHLGLCTTGVGHLITEHDEEYGKPVGTVVEQERVRNLFALDIAVTIDECKVLYPDFDDFDEELQHILCNSCPPTPDLPCLALLVLGWFPLSR